MAQHSLVVKQASLAGMAQAITTTHEDLVTQVESVLNGADSRMGAWVETTDSRAAERDYRRRLEAGVEELGELLATIATSLTRIAADAHDVEVENVALVD